MPNSKPIYNQLYADDKGRYFTFEKTPYRKKPYAIKLAQKIGLGTSLYRSRTEMSKFAVFMPPGWSDGLFSLDEANRVIQDWHLAPVPIFNGYPEAYKQLVAEAERLGLPQHYQNDLYKYDKEILCTPTAPAEFIWVLRKHGTHLLRLNSDMISAVQANFGRDHYWYHYSDGKLRQVTYDQALMIARDAAQLAQARY
jgi:hypothetical protein